MSSSAIAWAWRQRVGDSGQKLTLVAHAEFADESGAGFASLATISHMTESSIRTVRRHASKLGALGLMRREKRFLPNGARTSDLYRLIAPAEELKLGQQYKRSKPPDKLTPGPPDKLTPGAPDKLTPGAPDKLTPGAPDKDGLTPRSSFGRGTVKNEQSSLTMDDGPSDVASSIAHRIFDDLLKFNPTHHQPTWAKWEKDIAIMLTEGRSAKEILELWQFAHGHSFWKQNVLSPSALRRHFDRLTILRSSKESGSARKPEDALCSVQNEGGERCGNRATVRRGAGPWLCSACAARVL